MEWEIQSCALDSAGFSDIAWGDHDVLFSVVGVGTLAADDVRLAPLSSGGIRNLDAGSMNDGLDDSNDDTDDGGNWAAVSPEALRKATLLTPCAPWRNYNGIRWS